MKWKTSFSVEVVYSAFYDVDNVVIYMSTFSHVDTFLISLKLNSDGFRNSLNEGGKPKTVFWVGKMVEETTKEQKLTQSGFLSFPQLLFSRLWVSML